MISSLIRTLIRIFHARVLGWALTADRLDRQQDRSKD